MREYGRVYSTFWSSADVQSMSDDARTLALYLLTCSHGTIVGACRLPDGYVCEDLRWKPERVAKGFAELFRKGFANRCETTKWAWICKFLDWNQPDNPNQWKAARKIVAQIPDQCSWKPSFLAIFARAAGDPPPENTNGSGTVSEPFRNQDLDLDLEQELRDGAETGTKANKKQTEAPDDVQRVFEHWKQTHPHPRAKLDTKRRKLIREALKLFPVDDLCKSISGYRRSKWHMGENPDRKVYDDIELMLRNAKQIEQGLEHGDDAARNGQQPMFDPQTGQEVRW